MNQGKLEGVKLEMARLLNILGISELKRTGMGEFNSDNHCIYYYGQESLRRNGVAIIAGVQPQWIQGIGSGDGVGDQETIAYLNVN